MRVGLGLFFAWFTLFSFARDSADDPFAQLDEWAVEDTKGWSPYGFVEFASGRRLFNDPVINRELVLSDFRAQVKWEQDLVGGELRSTTDLYYDGVKENVELQLRELFWQGDLSGFGKVGENLDLKIGQQVLTWGTGDFVFLNDLFPKDFQSFFSGREDEYLKSPSAAVRLSGYSKILSADLVFTPRFTPDNFLNGEYFSFFSLQAGTNIAPDFVVSSQNRPEKPEWAIRLFTQYRGTEYAFYGYEGYFKSPNSADEQGNPRFSPLQVLGASVVSSWYGGLIKVEYAYYDSKEDALGVNPLVPNDQSRYLLGYEKELAPNFTGAVQWYLEHTQHHNNLIAQSNTPELEPSENRQVWTTRLTYLALQQTLTLTAFNFYSPSDADGYGRLRISYSPTDSWRASVGVNVFYGEQPQTFFSQLKDASNLFVAFRFNF